jgi:hypothetical protein
LSSSVRRLDEGETSVFERYSVPPYPAVCRRSRGGPLETVFVVARHGRKLLFFDDVEEEFAIGVPGEGDVLDTWDSYGELGYAIQALQTD